MTGTTSPTLQSRARGVALGAAVGDALGMPLEFERPRPVERLVRDMRSGRLPAGAFTDDTEMALALAETLLARPGKGLDANLLAAAFVDWYRRGPKDVGLQTSSMISAIQSGQTWEEAARRGRQQSPNSAGNGSLMRCWPVALAFHADRERLKSDSELQSLVTHPHPDCAAGYIFLNLLIAELLHGSSLPGALRIARSEAHFSPEVGRMLDSAPDQRRESLPNSGWVAHTLQTAVWALTTTRSFEEAVVQAANLGSDSDTSACVTGAAAGALYGQDAIPPAWVEALHGEWPLGSGNVLRAAEFERLADELVKMGA